VVVDGQWWVGGGEGPVMRPSRICMREGGGGGRWAVDGGMVGHLGLVVVRGQ
jgi:hypothetical protein